MGITQTELGHLLGVSRATISAWEMPMLDDLDNRIKVLSDQMTGKLSAGARVSAGVLLPRYVSKWNDAPRGVTQHMHDFQMGRTDVVPSADDQEFRPED